MQGRFIHCFWSYKQYSVVIKKLCRSFAVPHPTRRPGIFFTGNRGIGFHSCYTYKLVLGAALLTEQGCRLFSMELQDHSITALLASRNEEAFEQVFKTYFKNLHAYALSIVNDDADAEEMVQQVFFKLWDRADRLSFSGSIAAYLYRAVHNECLNFLKHEKVKTGHRLQVAYLMKNDATHEKAMNKELEQQFREAMNELPEQCRTVFQLSRFEDLKYREIADKLDISVKTVENHMGKALRLLRLKLVDFLPLLLLFFNH